ncbi:uncharacterized protein LOC114557745 isoform X2 [Perca flavescens]|uniref:uncharacterized protein LOC114557745 isoform X2 n=1 Tax=Perca flavescens TaxID=8167 RepID=UPI00106E1B2B|nr:uncharacterized protein LOC114557745 isoform X2 [Perca flavescens]
MEMEPQDDFCRFCKQNMRMVGLHKYSVNIFDRFGKPSISERLFHVGVTVVNRPVSNRICRRCVTFLTRLERDLPVYRRWIEDEKHDEASTSRSDKRDSEPRALIKLCHNPASPFGRNITEIRFTPMSMTCPQPPTTTAPPAPKYSRPTTENVIPKTARPSLTEFNLGFSKRLLLKDRAVPTLSGQPGDSEPQPGIRAEEGSILIVRDPSMKSEPDDIVISDTALLTPPATKEYVKAECASELGLNEGGSIQTVQDPSVKPKPGTADSSCGILPPVRHVASQTDPPKIKSVGTQLSMQTLQNPFRSKATQVKMPSRDCGVWTDTFPLDSPLLLLQPTLVKRPSKRPRLSLTDEEEGPSEPS